jgi:cytochrome c oxidase subunit 4
MSENRAEDGHHDDDHHHEHSIKPHIINLFVLFGLTALTYFTAIMHLGPLADIVALAIALTKASLVILIFMHVKEASSLIKVTAFSGFFWVFLFFAYLVIDVESRPDKTWYKGWQDEPRKVYEAAPDHH